MTCGSFSVCPRILRRLVASSFGDGRFDEPVTATNDDSIAHGDVGYPAWFTRQTEGSLAIRVGYSLVRIPSKNLEEI